MLFETRKEKDRRKKAKKHRTWRGRFHKFIFLTGLAITFKGLMGWLRNKRKEMRH